MVFLHQHLPCGWFLLHAHFRSPWVPVHSSSRASFIMLWCTCMCIKWWSKEIPSSEKNSHPGAINMISTVTRQHGFGPGNFTKVTNTTMYTFMTRQNTHTHTHTKKKKIFASAASGCWLLTELWPPSRWSGRLAGDAAWWLDLANQERLARRWLARAALSVLNSIKLQVSYWHFNTT